MNVIGWASNVNQIISDETSYSMGTNALKTESVQGSAVEESVNTCIIAPKVYNVKMSFDYSVHDSNGKTELDRFQEWYEAGTRNGAIAFEFPKIGDKNRICIYRITSAPSFSKSGLSQTVTMTWKEVPTDIIQISFAPASPDSILHVTNGEFILELTDIPNSVPLTTTYTYKIQKKGSGGSWGTAVALPITRVLPDTYNAKDYTCNYTAISDAGIYKVICDGYPSVAMEFTVE